MFFYDHDQAGYEVKLSKVPQRIICTVPSLTELLFDLGLGQNVVGVTRFCVKPAAAREKAEIIGGTKDLDIKLIRRLKPDLIIGNKEENVKEQIEEIKTFAPVWLSDINDISQACEAIEQIGEATNTRQKAAELTREINKQLALLREIPSTHKTVLYFMWNNPLMVAGENTYINNILTLCGLSNIAPNKAQRYPELSAEELKKLNPDIVFLSSEPFPFSTKELHNITRELAGTRGLIVDGEVFSWYGSRLIPALNYLRYLKSGLLKM